MVEEFAAGHHDSIQVVVIDAKGDRSVQSESRGFGTAAATAHAIIQLAQVSKCCGNAGCRTAAFLEGVRQLALEHVGATEDVPAGKFN